MICCRELQRTHIFRPFTPSWPHSLTRQNSLDARLSRSLLLAAEFGLFTRCFAACDDDDQVTEFLEEEINPILTAHATALANAEKWLAVVSV